MSEVVKQEQEHNPEKVQEKYKNIREADVKDVPLSPLEFLSGLSVFGEYTSAEEVQVPIDADLYNLARSLLLFEPTLNNPHHLINNILRRGLLEVAERYADDIRHVIKRNPYDKLLRDLKKET